MNFIDQLLRRKQMQDDLSEEIRLHLAARTEELVEAGMPRAEAEAAARREFGDVTQIEEYGREIWRWPAFETVLFDLRIGLRMLARNRSFGAIVILTLALGIGANTAIFSAIHAVLLRPLPFPQPDRLVFLSEASREIPEMYIAIPDLADWRARNTVFESIGAARFDNVVLTGRGEPQHISARNISSEFFPTFEVAPLLGRFLTQDEDKVGAPPVAIVSESFWTREFARDPRILDMSLKLNGESFTVIGVVPDSAFRLIFHSVVDVYTSLGRRSNELGADSRDEHPSIYAYARLKPGVSIEQARTEMTRLATQAAQRYPQTNSGITAVVEPLLLNKVEDVRQPLVLLATAVSLVLLIACANLANLLTSQAMARRLEIAIRSTLGAGRERLARQFLCESVLLAFMGGTLGVLVAYVATTGVLAMLLRLPPALVPRFDEIAIDHSALLFSLVISLLAGIALGIFPALAAYRADPSELLKENRRTTGSRLGHVRIRGVLVAAQLALSVVLVVAAGVVIKSLLRALQNEPGFRTDGLLTASLNLPSARYGSGSQQDALVQRLVDDVAGMPGVKATGFKSPPFFFPYEMQFSVEGHAKAKPGQEPFVEISSVTPGVLSALAIQLLEGRYLTSSDDENAPRVCLVDDLLAERYWPGQSPIGKHITIALTSRRQIFSATIVGLVRHVSNDVSGGPTLPGAYVAYAQAPVSYGSLVVFSDVDPAALGKALRKVLRRIDPDLALYDMQPLAELVAERRAPRTLSAILLGILAAIALLLASLGTYGVLAYMVAGRTQEIGLRRALGAPPRHVLWLILGQGMLVAVCGVMGGIAISVLTGRSVSAKLLGVSASDPVILAGVGGLLLAVSISACYIPARRAMRLDPLEAVRHE